MHCFCLISKRHPHNTTIRKYYLTTKWGVWIGLVLYANKRKSTGMDWSEVDFYIAVLSQCKPNWLCTKLNWPITEAVIASQRDMCTCWWSNIFTNTTLLAGVSILIFLQNDRMLTLTKWFTILTLSPPTYNVLYLNPTCKINSSKRSRLGHNQIFYFFMDVIKLCDIQPVLPR